MKKHENVLAAVFGSVIGLFALVFLFKWLIMKTELDYRFFDTPTRFIAWAFVIAFFGMMTLLVNRRLRSRSEAGMKPVSKLYRLSFILSFIPFVLLIVAAAESSVNGFTFITSTTYGADAFWGSFAIFGIYLLGVVIPVFPVIIFWQILYIVNRIRYRKKQANPESTNAP